MHGLDVLEGYDKLTTGIGRIFPELLAEIFLHCLAEHALWPRPNVTDIPMLLCRVCRVWRLVALGTPRLWTHVSLTFTAGRDRSQDATALRIWAERSQPCPISFSIHYKDGELGRLEELIEEARNHRHRWEQIIGLMPCAVFSGLWAPVTAEPSQSMLRVIYINILSDVPVGIPVVDLSGAYMVKRISLVYCGDHFCSIDLIPPSGRPNNLRTLHLFKLCVSTEKLWQLLSNSPLITECSIELIFWGPLSDPSPTLVTLPRLTILNFRLLDHPHGADFGPILSRLSLPKLESCSVRTPSVPSLTSWPHVMNMLRQSQPPLQKLTLGGWNMSEGEFIECLQAAPQLDYLSIKDIPFAEAILDALTLMPSEDASGGWRGHCPKMTGISFMECIPISEECLTRMILSRRGPFYDHNLEDDGSVQALDKPAILQSVAVSWCEVNPSLRENPEIEEFMRDGLEFDIYNGSNSSPTSSDAGGG